MKYKGVLLLLGGVLLFGGAPIGATNTEDEVASNAESTINGDILVATDMMLDTDAPAVPSPSAPEEHEHRVNTHATNGEDDGTTPTDHAAIEIEGLDGIAAAASKAVRHPQNDATDALSGENEKVSEHGHFRSQDRSRHGSDEHHAHKAETHFGHDGSSAVDGISTDKISGDISGAAAHDGLPRVGEHILEGGSSAPANGEEAAAPSATTGAAAEDNDPRPVFQVELTYETRSESVMPVSIEFFAAPTADDPPYAVMVDRILPTPAEIIPLVVGTTAVEAGYGRRLVIRTDEGEWSFLAPSPIARDGHIAAITTFLGDHSTTSGIDEADDRDNEAHDQGPHQGHAGDNQGGDRENAIIAEGLSDANMDVNGDTISNVTPTPAAHASTGADTPARPTAPPIASTAGEAAADATMPFQHKGCFAMDDNIVKGVEQEFPTDLTMTPTVCFKTCTEAGDMHFWITRGDTCLCIPETVVGYLEEVPNDSGVCDSPCAGDATQHCGGPKAFDAYVARSDLDVGGSSTPPEPVFDVKLELETSPGTFMRVLVGLFAAPSADTPAHALVLDMEDPTLAQIIPLEAGTTVEAGPGDRGLVIRTDEGEWRFRAPNYVLRDDKVAAITTFLRDHATTSGIDHGNDRNNDEGHDQGHSRDSNAGGHNGRDKHGDHRSHGHERTSHEVLRKTRVEVKGYFGRWRPFELSIIDGSGLKRCTVTQGRATSSCEDLALDGSSEVVVLDEEKGQDRFTIRVTTGAPRGRDNKMWVIDLKTPHELNEVVELVRGIIVGSPEVDLGMQHPNIARNPNDEFVFDQGPGLRSAKPIPAFRGGSLSPGDTPLRPGQYLSTAPLVSSINLAVTEVGDLILRRGDLPSYSDPDPPLWAYRATGSFGGKANGGLACAVESWWIENVLEDTEIPMTLSVTRGRMRVGRGRFCTMWQSTKPAGSWRVNLPWSARGEAIRTASLQLLESGNAVVASGDEVFWDSSSPES